MPFHPCDFPSAPQEEVWQWQLSGMDVIRKMLVLLHARTLNIRERTPALELSVRAPKKNRMFVLRLYTDNLKLQFHAEWQLFY